MKIFFGRIIGFRNGKNPSDIMLNYRVIDSFGNIQNKVCFIKDAENSRANLLKQAQLYHKFFKDISIRDEESLICFVIKSTETADYLSKIISNHSFKLLESNMDAIAKLDFDFIYSRYISKNSVNEAVI